MVETVFKDCAPVFIVGAGRSGTTLLQSLLNAHPDFAIFGELHYFSKVLQIRDHLPSLAGRRNLDRFFESFLQTTNTTRYVPGAELLFHRVEKRLQDLPAPTYEHFYRFVIEEFASVHGATRGGEKTPENVRFLVDLVELFPEGRVIHVVRDPRDVVCSLKKMAWASRSVVVNALKWRVDVLSGLRDRGKGDHYLQVRYEDLVSDTELELSRVFGFLGVEGTECVLEFHKQAERYLKQESWNEGVRQPVFASSVSRWRRELSDSEVVLIEGICGRVMDHLGYERARFGLSARAAVPGRLVWDLSKYVRHKGQEMVSRRRARKQRPGAIFGDSRRLRAKFWRSLGGGKGRL